MSYKIEFNSDIFSPEKSLDEIPITLLSSLRFILNNLPDGITINIDVNGKAYDHIDEYVDDRIEDFFDIPDEMYESLVGKCFLNSDKSIAVKIVGLTNVNYEFLYEMYERFKKHSTWDVKDHNWLQDQLSTSSSKDSDVYKKYESYALTDQTDINLAGENMFHIGKDGNLYVDTTCGDDYDVYMPIKESRFELIKAEALENCTND